MPSFSIDQARQNVLIALKSNQKLNDNLEIIYKQIEAASKKGESEVMVNFSHLKVKADDSEKQIIDQELIDKILGIIERQGYEWDGATWPSYYIFW